jgi:hypothetical protein
MDVFLLFLRYVAAVALRIGCLNPNPGPELGAAYSLSCSVCSTHCMHYASFLYVGRFKSFSKIFRHQSFTFLLFPWYDRGFDGLILYAVSFDAKYNGVLLENRRSGGQEIRLLWNKNIHYCDHTNPPLSQINLVYLRFILIVFYVSSL